MESTQPYTCENCGGRMAVSADTEDPPQCCNQKMTKLELPVCEVSSTAEHSRLSESIEPCDDGRAGKS
ncbi:MAG: hypothetical protein V2B19_33295 [Pseudomonadota bacterium]